MFCVVAHLAWAIASLPTRDLVFRDGKVFNFKETELRAMRTARTRTDADEKRFHRLGAPTTDDPGVLDMGFVNDCFVHSVAYKVINSKFKASMRSFKCFNYHLGRFVNHLKRLDLELDIHTNYQFVLHFLQKMFTLSSKSRNRTSFFFS